MAFKVTADTIINKIGPCTRKEIVQVYHSDLWDRAECVASSLLNLQKVLVGMLPKYKSLLPDEFAKLQGKEAQMNLLDYIRLKSIYAFADEAFKVLDKLCHDLADAENAQDQDGIESNSLKIEALCKIQLDDFITDEVTGFQRLNEKRQELRGESIISDWIVFKNQGYTWSFGDIVGTINKEGVRDEGLWQDAINDSLPEGVSIGTLLDSDEMIRIY